MFLGRKITLGILLTMLCASAFAGQRTHLVKPGDTLYSIAKRYEVTVEAIQAANPSIDGTNIPAGMTLVIPDKSDDQKKSSVWLFGKKDKNSTTNNQNKSAVGTPSVTTKSSEVVKSATSTTAKPADSNTVKPQQESRQDVVSTVTKRKMFGQPDNIAVIMPFNLDAQTSDDDKQQMRSVEFYEGLLLAVNEAQEKGQRVQVQTYDLGTHSISEILANSSLRDADVIIGPMEQNEVKQVAAFGDKYGINVVSPFAFNQELASQYSHLIQLNTSKSLLYPDLTEDLIARFKGYDFVFLTDSNFVSKSDPYAGYLRGKLKEKGIKSYNFSYRNPERLVKVDSLLKIEDHDILYIPVANSKDAMRRMFPCIQCNTFGEDSVALNKSAILGYPEWVLYAGDFMDYYYDLNVYMFSKMYTNPLDEDVKSFNSNFRYWYGKNPMQLIPRYATLGYDIGKYFLTALRQYGPSFDQHLENFEKESLQSSMHFKRVDGRGFINSGSYLVHFTPSTQIEKYEIK